MNNLTKLLPAAALSLLVLVSPAPASAGIEDGLGTWEGQGSASDVSGKDLGAFTVSVTRQTTAPGKVRTDGKVILSDGKQIVIWQEIESHGASGFRIVSNNGSGGGQCFGNGLCQSYETAANGHAFATTIAVDGKTALRILVTELENGRAVRFFQQTLQKKP